MGKTFTIDVRKLKETNTYNLKGVSTLQINTKYEEGAYKSIKAKGSTVTLEMYTGNDEEYVTINLNNCNSLQNLYYTTDDGSKYDKENNRIGYVIGVIEADTITTPDKADGDVVTGTIWDDTVDMHTYAVEEDKKGLTINTLAGDDKITGTTGNDTITGSAGKNTIYHSGGDDVVKLTKGEELTLDYSATNGQAVTYTVGGAKNTDLVINMGDKGSVTLANFVKSDVTGAKGSVKFTNDCEIPLKDLNNSTLIDYDESDLKWVNKKKTATLTGTRLGDEINIDALAVQATAIGAPAADFDPTKIKYAINAGEGKNVIVLENAHNTNTITSGSGDDAITIVNTSDTTQFSKAVTTVKAGAGKNDITVGGTGKNLLITGNGNDTFTISGTSTTTIKAGGGENTIALTSDTFGNIVLAEEKIKNTTNDISIANIGNTDGEGKKIYALTKTGNDLVISNAGTNSSFTASGWFLSGSKYSTKTINDYNLSEALDTYGLGLNVTGSGTIKGTDLNENIYSADSVSGKAKNDKIYAGKGNDTINAGDGKNSIYMYAGDGIDTIENGYGSDTLVFKKGTSINIGFVESGEYDDEGRALYDMRIYYSKDKSDYALIKGAVVADGDTYVFNQDETSVEKIKVGSKTYKLEALVNRNKIENVLTDGKVVGTVKHDDIYVTDKTKFKDAEPITINGDKGNDVVMIGSNWAEDEGEVINNTDNYNVDPAQYDTVNIEPTVYTHITDGNQDTTLGVYDKVVSYASGDGTYYAQSAISDIKVYGFKTDDTYHTYYDNQFSKLYDESGDNDVLNIKDKAHGDLKLIFNVTKDYKDWGTEIAKIETITDGNKHDVVSLMVNSLQEVKIVTSDDRNYFLENPEENNDIGIDIDYWGDKDAHDSEGDFDEKTEALLFLGKDKLAKFGSGVEKIYANDGWFITSDDIVTVASKVAEWLNADSTKSQFGTFDSVEAVLESGNTDALAAVLNVFDENTNWTNGNV
ncbi:MAG: calcium-binding protein [Cyanobacteria bacterium RUI128]|nr:calcium-binding protein [Cyanobacteria bacterium RUI128]